MNYAKALVVTAIAVLIRLLLDPILGNRMPALTMLVAIAIAVWYYRWKAATLTAAVGFVAILFLFVSPRYQFPSDIAILYGLIGYAVSAAAVIVFGEQLHRTREKLEAELGERKKTEESLRASEATARAASAAKDAFLAQLSHELRTPLTPVLMAAAAMRENLSLPKDAREQLAMIERNITLEARLIDDLLDVTRITEGKFRLRNESCDLHSLFAHVVEIIRDNARERNIKITLDLQAEESHLTGDPTRLQQVFWNLLINALKFTPEGGHIWLRSTNLASDEGTWLCVDVEDDGVGLEDGTLDTIFEPFQQGVQRGDARFPGLGLGLTIAKAIVNLHGGTIKAKSPGLGKGSTFSVDLPGARRGPPVSAPEPLDDTPVKEADAHLHLLVVEDHAPTLEVLAMLLKRAGHQVTTVGNVAAALAAAKANRFDAVISDLGLPDGTGHELMRQLRNEHQLQGIALSGYGTEDDIQRSLQAGFSEHLTKPIRFAEVRRALQRLLQDR